MAKLFGLLFVVTMLVIQSQATTLFEEEVRVLNDIFGKNKDNLKLIRPPGEPTNVTVNMYVRNILSLCEEKHIWKVQLTFRQEWTDSRLAYTSTLPEFKYLPYSNAKHIWVPDLFFSNEIHSDDHDLLTPNTLIRIFPDGNVVYSTRITLEVFCPADFNHKEIVCPLRIASYGFSKDELSIHWTTEDAVQVSKNIFIPGYTFDGVTTTQCDSSTKLGVFSCISADFKFGHGVCKA